MPAVLKKGIWSGAIGGITPQVLATAADAELAECIVSSPSPECPAGSRFQDMVWWWPQDVAGHYRPSMRKLDFSRLAFFPKFAGHLKRYILAVMLFPSLRMTGLPAWRVRVAKIGRLLAQLAAAGFSGLDAVKPNDLALAYKASFGNGRASTSGVAAYLSEMKGYCARRVTPDCMGGIPVPCNFIEVLSMGAPLEEKPEAPPDESQGYRSLPDRFTNAVGGVIFFYIREVLPELARLIRQLGEADLFEFSVARTKVHGGRTGSLSEARTRDLRRERICSVLAAFDWRKSDGAPLRSLAFKVCAEVRRGLSDHEPPNEKVLVSPNFSFPPRSFDDLLALWAATMAALFQVLLLVTGGRVSEVEHLDHRCLPDCEPCAIQELAGRTRKPSASASGSPKSWPLPGVVADAVRHQLEIARVASGKETGCLWLHVRHQRRGKPEFGYHVNAFAANHGLDQFGDDVPVHPHRFRKTVARLVVLTLVEGVPLLQDLLGHSNLEATLIYLLSDRDIRADLAEAGMEIRTENAHAVANGAAQAGGRGGELLRVSMQEFFDQIGVPQAEREQKRRVEEFVAKLLFDGTLGLRIIAPGVLCVKPAGAIGACGTDVVFSRCQATCRFYAQLPWTKRLVQSNVIWILNKLDALNKKGELAALELKWWTEQLRDQLSVFDDIKQKFANDNRVLAALSKGA